MNDTEPKLEADEVSEATLKEILDLLLGLSHVLQNHTKQVTEDKNFHASLYFQPLNSRYLWSDDILRCNSCQSVNLATAVLKLLVRKSKDIPDPKGYFLKTLSLETSCLLVKSTFQELDCVIERILPDLLKLYEPVKGGQGSSGIKIRTMYRFRAENCIGNKGRWFRGVARIIYRYHLGRAKRDIRDGFALV